MKGEEENIRLTTTNSDEPLVLSAMGPATMAKTKEQDLTHEGWSG